MKELKINMHIPPNLEQVVEIRRQNMELEANIAKIEEQIQQNYQGMIKDFFPYLLSLYENWHPRLGEIAISINLEMGHCYEVTVRSVDGYRVRAQEGSKPVYHTFELNPRAEEYEVAIFIIPKQAYEDNHINKLFALQFLHPVTFRKYSPL